MAMTDADRIARLETELELVKANLAAHQQTFIALTEVLAAGSPYEPEMIPKRLGAVAAAFRKTRGRHGAYTATLTEQLADALLAVIRARVG